MKNLFHELAQRRDDSFALHNKSRTYIDINSVRNQFILITSEGLSGVNLSVPSPTRRPTTSLFSLSDSANLIRMFGEFRLDRALRYAFLKFAFEI